MKLTDRFAFCFSKLHAAARSTSTRPSEHILAVSTLESIRAQPRAALSDLNGHTARTTVHAPHAWIAARSGLMSWGARGLSAPLPLDASCIPGRRCEQEQCTLRTFAHSAQSAYNDAAINPIPIADEVARRLIPRKSLGDLTRNPFCRRICCDVDPDQVSAV